jgi:hypothetical protein
MFYLLRNEQIAAAETFDRAAALVKEGWKLTTRDHYMAWWKAYDALRMQQLFAAARGVPLLEQEVGGHDDH